MRPLGLQAFPSLAIIIEKREIIRLRSYNEKNYNGFCQQKVREAGILNTGLRSKRYLLHIYWYLCRRKYIFYIYFCVYSEENVYFGIYAEENINFTFFGVYTAHAFLCLCLAPRWFLLRHVEAAISCSV